MSNKLTNQNKICMLNSIILFKMCEVMYMLQFPFKTYRDCVKTISDYLEISIGYYYNVNEAKHTPHKIIKNSKFINALNSSGLSSKLFDPENPSQLIIADHLKQELQSIIFDQGMDKLNIKKSLDLIIHYYPQDFWMISVPSEAVTQSNETNTHDENSRYLVYFVKDFLFKNLNLTIATEQDYTYLNNFAKKEFKKYTHRQFLKINCPEFRNFKYGTKTGYTSPKQEYIDQNGLSLSSCNNKNSIEFKFSEVQNDYDFIRRYNYFLVKECFYLLAGNHKDYKHDNFFEKIFNSDDNNPQVLKKENLTLLEKCGFSPDLFTPRTRSPWIYTSEYIFDITYDILTKYKNNLPLQKDLDRYRKLLEIYLVCLQDSRNTQLVLSTYRLIEEVKY